MDESAGGRPPARGAQAEGARSSPPERKGGSITQIGTSSREKGQEALLRRAVKGDPAAFEELVQGEERRLFAVTLRYMRNRPDAEDCLQEAMLRIYRSLALFKQNSSFSTWAYRITVNVCLDELRRRKNAAQASLDDMTDAQLPPDNSDRPDETAEKGELARNVRRAIGELPDDMRTVILLRDVEGYSYEEISQMTGAAEGTVKSRISRAREKLRQVFLKKPELFDVGTVKNI